MSNSHRSFPVADEFLVHQVVAGVTREASQLPGVRYAGGYEESDLPQRQHPFCADDEHVGHTGAETAAAESPGNILGDLDKLAPNGPRRQPFVGDDVDGGQSRTDAADVAARGDEDQSFETVCRRVAERKRRRTVVEKRVEAAAVGNSSSLTLSPRAAAADVSWKASGHRSTNSRSTRRSVRRLVGKVWMDGRDNGGCFAVAVAAAAAVLIDAVTFPALWVAG